MSFEITTMEDVYKFTLPLYDFLKKNGDTEIAAMFEELVDACFEKETDSIIAHRKAFKKVLEEVFDLPPAYQKALKESLELLA